MPRPLRIEYAGAICHMMNRGDRRELIAHDDPDRELFLVTLAEACRKTQWQALALCLMPNHFHLVVETPQPNLIDGMKWLLGTYTARLEMGTWTHVGNRLSQHKVTRAVNATHTRAERKHRPPASSPVASCIRQRRNRSRSTVCSCKRPRTMPVGSSSARPRAGR